MELCVRKESPLKQRTYGRFRGIQSISNVSINIRCFAITISNIYIYILLNIILIATWAFLKYAYFVKWEILCLTMSNFITNWRFSVTDSKQNKRDSLNYSMKEIILCDNKTIFLYLMSELFTFITLINTL